MADRKKPPEDTHESFKDDGAAIGQVAGGELDIFPLSELNERIAERDRQEAAWQAAIDGETDADDEA